VAWVAGGTAWLRTEGREGYRHFDLAVLDGGRPTALRVLPDGAVAIGTEHGCLLCLEPR
jgi:hypothetical protein